MKPLGYWTFERCKEAAQKVKTRNELRKKYAGGYDAVLRNKWWDRLNAEGIRLAHGRHGLLFGTGIYDGPRPAKANIIYGYWKRMIERGYSQRVVAMRPTYADVTVCQSWHLYSNFEKWVLTMGALDGLELDKDILCPGNKVYSPDTCCFVPKYLNVFLNKNKALRGSLPPGVRIQRIKCGKKFQGQLSFQGKRVHLGTYDTPQQAHQAYLKARAERIREIAENYPDPRIREGLLRHVKLYTDQLND